ncbi:MAG TPA: hypothetical protein DEA22_04080 [Blastocatellia bacterium]|nr:hypothetical protein [Blastocatellia bacterium]
MKTDIVGRADIEKILVEFYESAMSDADIGHHFVELNLSSHLPIITDFWEKVLFGKPVYFGNPLAVHRELHLKNEITSGHFDRWLEIFYAVVDGHFAGDMAETAKMRAKAIAESLLQRLGGDAVIQRGR